MSSTTNKEEKKCCDLCEGNHSLFTGNARIDCPCHTPQSEKQDVPSLNPSYDTYYKQSEEAISDIKSKQEDKLLKSFLNDTEKQKIREEWLKDSDIDSIYCDGITYRNKEETADYWLSILDKTIKSKLEAVEGAFMEANKQALLDTKVVIGELKPIMSTTQFWGLVMDLLNKHK